MSKSWEYFLIEHAVLTGDARMVAGHKGRGIDGYGERHCG